MKKTVYTKAGQVGLDEVERPQIEAPDDAVIRIVRTCGKTLPPEREKVV